MTRPNGNPYEPPHAAREDLSRAGTGTSLTEILVSLGIVVLLVLELLASSSKMRDH